MALYNLKCVMRFTDGRDGAAFDNVEIEADTPEAAIEKAKTINPAGPEMSFDAAILADFMGRVIWTLHGSNTD